MDGGQTFGGDTSGTCRTDGVASGVDPAAPAAPPTAAAPNHRALRLGVVRVAAGEWHQLIGPSAASFKATALLAPERRYTVCFGKPRQHSAHGLVDFPLQYSLSGDASLPAADPHPRGGEALPLLKEAIDLNGADHDRVEVMVVDFVVADLQPCLFDLR